MKKTYTTIYDGERIRCRVSDDVVGCKSSASLPMECSGKIVYNTSPERSICIYAWTRSVCDGYILYLAHSARKIRMPMKSAVGDQGSRLSLLIRAILALIMVSLSNR